MRNLNNPAVYVGTYSKYNDGSIFGAWLDLTEFSDREEFFEACAKLHGDEQDAEFMFQDFENFPRDFYCESDCSEQLFQWVHMDDDDKEKVNAYIEYCGAHYLPSDLEEVIEKVIFLGGPDESESDIAYELAEEWGIFDSIPEQYRGYFNYESWFSDLQMNGFQVVQTENGWFEITG